MAEDLEAMSIFPPSSDPSPNQPATPALTFGNARPESKPSEFAHYFEEFLNSDFHDFSFYEEGAQT